ncbi:MAG TPA: methionyl-tRNA formyltransferase [Stellaceae bacterium]|jgi:methionyl-tRNA formyltransferase|nr:methionyl-tRNA formyltransferase [Stellaceae bacterium]
MKQALDLVFMGTPEFATTILDALLAAGHRLKAVYSQPPRPAGRGHRVLPSPVQELAEDRGIAVRCPTSLRDPATQAEFAALAADAAIVAAYGLILPPAILSGPRLGCLNVHASLLPRWRGAAPIQRAILDGDCETGVTIMQMDAGLDTGAILLQHAEPIHATTTAGELTRQLAALGGEQIVTALDRLTEGTLHPHPQPDTGATYAKKLSRDEARLDWRLPASRLERQVRAFDPWPGAYFLAGPGAGERIRVLSAEVMAEGGAPGTVLDELLTIACGDGALRPLQVQRAGRGAMDAAALLRGFALPPGTVLPIGHR